MTAPSGRRALHYVLKIGDREASIKFYRDLLGMTPLRHEEFEGGCEATCNGPYDNKWSKTMIGYGPEDTNFVLELTYNYTVGSYKLGNDLSSLSLTLPQKTFQAVKAVDAESQGYVTAPDGYKFFYQQGDKSLVNKVTLNCSNLEESLKYWNGQLGMTVKSKSDSSALLSFGEGQSEVELNQLSTNAGGLDRGTAFGRTAFAVPGGDLKEVESSVKAAGYNIQTPFVTLPTPGKADVQVVIFADPDGHEICFVGDEGFRDLSQVDPKANELLNEALDKDGSKAWYAKKGKTKTDG